MAGWTWQDSERLAASWMKRNGFRDARLTAGGADGGIDIVASKAMAQVKHEQRPVGRPALQRLVGARGRAERALLFFSSSGYSAGAVAYANQMNIALFVSAPPAGVSPANAAARRLAKQAANGERANDMKYRAREAARIADKMRRASDLAARELAQYREAALGDQAGIDRRPARAAAKAAARAAKTSSKADKAAARAIAELRRKGREGSVSEA